MRQQSFITINFDRCFQAFILLAPIIWLPGIKQNSLQFICLNYGALILFSLAMYSGKQRESRNPFIPLIFGAVIGLSLIINPKAYPVGLLYVTSGALLYYSIVFGVKDGKKILWALVAICGVNIVISLCQKFGFYLIYDNVGITNGSFIQAHLSMPGLMGRNYHLSYMLIFVAPLCFILNKYLGIIAVIISTVFVFLVESYICKLSLGIMLFVLLSSKVNVKILIVLALIAASTIIFLKKDKIKGKIAVRLPAYHYIMNESLVNIFKGKGLGSFDIDSGINSNNPKFESSFNQYLKIIYEIGLIPFIAIAGVIVAYFRKFKSKSIYFMASLSSILTYPMFHEVLRFARLDILIITVLALFEVSCIDRQGEIYEN